MVFRFLLLVSIVTLISCSSDKRQPPSELNILPANGPSDLTFTVDAPLYGTRAHTRHQFDENAYYTRVSNNGSVVVYNETTGVSRHFSVMEDDKFALSYPCSVHMINEDDVVVFGSSRAVRYRLSDSAIVDYFTFSKSSSDIPAPDGYFVPMDPSYPLAGHGNKVYTTLRRDDGDPFSFPYVYEGPSIGEMDLESKTLRPLDISHDHGGVFYGALHKENIAHHDNSLYIAYEFSPDVYQYNLATGTMKKHKLPAFQGSENRPFTGASDPTDMIQHLNQSVAYGKLYFSNDGATIFQVMLVPSTENPGKTRVGAVRKMNRNFEVLKEGRLPKYSVPGNVFVTDDQLHFQYNKSSSKEGEIFYRTLE